MAETLQSYKKNFTILTEIFLKMEKQGGKIVFLKWVLMDSNHRSRKTADLQSAPFGHSGKHPFSKSGCKGTHLF